MAKLTGRIYKERYALCKRNNSFYEEQRRDTKIGDEYLTEVPEVIYYIDKRSGCLNAKETTLIW